MAYHFLHKQSHHGSLPAVAGLDGARCLCHPVLRMPHEETTGTIEKPHPSPSPERLRLVAECALLFLIFPIVLYFLRYQIIPILILIILGFAGGCTAVLLHDRSFDRRLLWNPTGFRRRIKRILLIFLCIAPFATAFMFFGDPDRFLGFPRARPRIWMAVMALYPVLSAYPQEIIFRAFFFHRYRRLFPTEASMVRASAVAFGVAHLFLANWIAPVFATAGGYLFARTYARTQSTLAAGFEHGLWGDFLFTIGLGWYFYAGSIGWH